MRVLVLNLDAGAGSIRLTRQPSERRLQPIRTSAPQQIVSCPQREVFGNVTAAAGTRAHRRFRQRQFPCFVKLAHGFPFGFAPMLSCVPMLFPRQY